jgi:putative two-component system response regulator
MTLPPDRVPFRILLVDDSPPLLVACRNALLRAGMDVTAVGSGAEAESAAGMREFDAAVFDVLINGSDGIEIAMRVRERARNPRLPILFLTHVDDIETIERALAAGGDDYIRKPPNYRELQARVRAAAHRYRLVRDLETAEDVLLSMARLIEAKDGSTAQHCERLATATTLLGRTLGLPENDLAALRWGSMLHDVGKVGIPDAILLKPGPLSTEERAFMERHVEIGAELIAPLRSFESVRPIVLYHHEHFDGSGYPSKLAGSAIPYLARVFQVVDVFDALVSPRPYKASIPVDAALGILEAEATKGYWDPDVTREFVGLVRRQRSLFDGLGHNGA